MLQLQLPHRHREAISPGNIHFNFNKLLSIEKQNKVTFFTLRNFLEILLLS